MSMFIHGVGQCQVIDKSGEVVDLKGHDITSLAKTGTFNWEHQSNTPATLVGKILKAKKIFSKADCANEHELYFWEKCKLPYLYVMGELLDDYTASAKECAGQMRYSKDNPDKAPLLGFSIEGSEIPNTRKGMVITRSIARKCTLTAAPCNSMCVAEILDTNEKPQIKDDFEEIFKSEANAIELFKSGEGEKIYEEYLAKKENMELISLAKSEPQGWKVGGLSNDAAHYHHPEHGIVSIHKQPSGLFHVKHNGAIAGVEGEKGVFATPERAVSHAKKYMENITSGKTRPQKMHDQSSPSMVGMKKAIEAGSYNAAPSVLSGGAVYQTESMAQPKKDWNKRAKQEYDNWPHKEKFESFMKARMPHLAEGEIRAIGRVMALKKAIDIEKSLELLVSLKKVLKS